MLDLELLEKQLDEVLAQETSETMTTWLYNRRLKKYVSTLGEGTFANIPSNKIEITQTKEHIVKNNTADFSQDYNYSDCDYLFAA
ncbi:hypothetical protein [Flavobacterium sp.]|jgi:hypothetical protein|uniref:hypothetical protein n=1 Tax=Flavobacterium sp. TaxID=239 RepID=UPI0037BEF2D4